MNAVGLNSAGNVHEIFVDHGHKCYAMVRREIAKDLIESADVIGPVVGRQRDAGEQHFDMCAHKCRNYRVKIIAGLIGRKTAQAVIAAEFDNGDGGMKREDRAKIGNGIFGGCAACALVDYLVAVAELIKLTLKRSRIRLIRTGEAVTCGDAVAVADQDWAVGRKERSAKGQKTEVDEQAAASVHGNSVDVRGEERRKCSLRISQQARKVSAQMGDPGD